MADNITKEYKDESMKTKAPANVTSTIASLSTDIINESNNTTDEMCDEIAAETLLKDVNNLKTERKMSKENKYLMKYIQTIHFL